MKGDRDNGKASTRPGGAHCSCCTKGKKLASKYRRRLAQVQADKELFETRWNDAQEEVAVMRQMSERL